MEVQQEDGQQCLHNPSFTCLIHYYVLYLVLLLRHIVWNTYQFIKGLFLYTPLLHREGVGLFFLISSSEKV